MRIVALRHVLFEDLGVWAPVLRERGHTVEYLEAGEALDRGRDADLVIILGGPVGLADARAYPFLEEERGLVAHRLAEDAPVIGVCLGAQLMAAALGAKVYSLPAHEIGWGRLALAPAAADTPLAALADAPVLHWHRDTFEVPDGATLLASSGPTPHQAFTYGRSLALQFHAEVAPGMIERWLVGHAVELAAAGIDVGRLRSDSTRHSLAAARAGRAMIDAYLDSMAS